MISAHHAYLLDTSILLGATIAPQRLAAPVRRWLCDPNNTIHFSAASIWEIAIKRSLNRKAFDFDPRDIQGLALETGFTELPVLGEHCHAVATMPWHHRDPFDRLLVAQAQSLPAHLLTSDRLLAAYGELVVPVTLKS